MHLIIFFPGNILVLGTLYFHLIEKFSPRIFSWTSLVELILDQTQQLDSSDQIGFRQTKLNHSHCYHHHHSRQHYHHHQSIIALTITITIPLL